MFDCTWGIPHERNKSDLIENQGTMLSVDSVQYVALLLWEEHCIECAPPQCYESCSKYKRRADKKCMRMSYGFLRNSAWNGVFDYGVDCQFEPWAKIECNLNLVGYNPEVIRRIDSISNSLSYCVFKLSHVLKKISPTLKLTGLFNVVRNKIISFLPRSRHLEFDAFVLECYSFSDTTYQLQFHCEDENNILLQCAFEIVPGKNYLSIPFSKFGFVENSSGLRLYIFPENDRTERLIFTWLDFVKFKKSNKDMMTGNQKTKIKCVAWDLDNTLWKGVLIEDGLSNIQLNERAIDVISALDKRGIIHTIVSKNNHDEVVKALEAFGISEYFISPAVNWGAKSESLKTLSERLNVGLDTFAFVDDSVQERTEVSASLPMVRIYTENQIDQLLTAPEFDVPITEMSRLRRASYTQEVERKEVQASYGSNYEDFLRDLEMNMEVFVPKEAKDRIRCYELLQRSNQLNISTYRYTEEEFNKLLYSESVLCFAMRCSDKFGDYGLCGFISILLTPHPTIKDMVVSCRIAQKRFEHALMYCLAQYFQREGFDRIDAKLIKTKRNGPLVSVFQSLPFEVSHESTMSIAYELSDLSLVKDEKIIQCSFIGKKHSG